MSSGAILVHCILVSAGLIFLGFASAEDKRWWRALIANITGVALIGTSIALLVRGGWL